MRKVYLGLFFLLAAIQLQAQVSLSGYVQNDNGEPLIGASVFLKSSDYATITDEKGYYQLDDIFPGDYDLKITYLGLKSHTEFMTLEESGTFDVALTGSIFEIDEIEVTANYLNDETPFTYSEMDKEDIELKNLGQDIPFLLEHTPSMVVTSDAGAGIGYTGMRIRGSDGTRINVTINGVPLNDSESHGVFWVDLPDFGSSTDNIQIQRGVGPSTMGAGAFGATVGLNTNKINLNPFVKFDGTYGSFNTQKYSVSVGTGLMNDKYTLEGRYTQILSDGYVDRGASDLSSWYVTAAKIGERHSLRINAFSGEERTYQSWYGVPEAKITGNEQDLLTHYDNNVGVIYLTPEDSINLFDSDRRYNYYTYEDEVDNYVQSHFQLIYQVQPSDAFKINTTLHYTNGGGFFESYKRGQDLQDYNLAGELRDTFDNEVVVTDLVRRKWLRNHFYGAIINAKYEATDALDLQFGIGVNRYDGEHVGNVIFIPNVVNLNTNFPYYSSDATKDDANAYVKADYSITDKFSLYGDLQYRTIKYTSFGSDDGDILPEKSVNIDASYNFFNPKFGLNYKLKENQSVYLSYAKAHREPVRSDFVDANTDTYIPRPESLNDIELGFKMQGEKFGLNANGFLMLYKDQLVVTGAVNDVGGSIRVNVDESYRYGIELSGAYAFTDKLRWAPNLAVSQNKIAAFTEVIINYDTGVNTENEFENTNIALSPNIVAGSRLSYSFSKNLNAHLLSKYVGKQYLDNTNNENKTIDAYLVNDIVLSYAISNDFIQNAELKLSVNNVLNTEFVSNGYTYSYISGGLVEENAYYPQARINFLLGASVSF